MPVYRLPSQALFPPSDHAEPSGLLAVGGDLSEERLLKAYMLGIFPWYSQPPILWWSPDPRMFMTPSQLRVGRSLKKTLKKHPFELKMDTAFEQVIRACAVASRPDQEGTWITEEMIQAFVSLHRSGFAHSAEAWHEGRLVAGLYGLSVGRFFAGESMFTRVSDGSKITYVRLVQQLERWSFTLIDAQVHTDHLARFGAKEGARVDYLQRLDEALLHETRRGPWRFDADLARSAR